ncbi:MULTISPECIES: amino acid ABC transporter permease [Streptomyces]|uniref:Amino acid ABC transporter permease n=1 Tax=Streptomyces malaysiensis TaxID=92644 RepID=A0ABX6WFT5_STRMQ|nr:MULTISPECIES: amino acid ABC transporter permease [Streptomyces]AUA09588.1 L-cystine transport system permease protein TcyB [Streptomyces sp. M56]MCC4314617.1 amino acid ABC transporter permease [Streptomyces malaysiensis]MCD9589751.1 amino acid ABC transporter permease [Streptomyces sp. 8ZJF_21]MCM3806577.1 amino acid ABC transporter permease [Streptomyces sp. DR7-3]MYX58956.1 ABC transporter permease subunit [Streptomyces sp. SID8382]
MTKVLNVDALPEPTVLKRAKRRRPGLLVANAIVLVLAAMAVTTIFTNPRFEWETVAKYFFEIRVLKGIGVSIGMTAVTMALSLVSGTLVALMRMGDSRLMSTVAAAFIWVFRSIPMLVQLLFWYNLAALFPTLSLGIPWGPRFITFDSNSVIGPLTAAIIGLTLHETAYIAELIRSGLLAVPDGQRQAASALGLTPAQIFFRVTLPQALRVIVPPMGNELISLLKATSLVSVITLADLLYSVQLIYAKNFQTVPLLIVAAIWYMIITGVITLLQQRLERRLGRHTMLSADKAGKVKRIEHSV